MICDQRVLGITILSTLLYQKHTRDYYNQTCLEHHFAIQLTCDQCCE